MFFNFIKFCTYLILILILSTGTYNYLSNGLLGNNCLSDEIKMIKLNNLCKLNWITMFSLANKRDMTKLNLL